MCLSLCLRQATNLTFKRSVIPAELMSVCLCTCMCVCLCVCDVLCESARDHSRPRQRYLYVHVCVFLCVQLREELESKKRQAEEVSIHAHKPTHTQSHLNLLKGRDWPICMLMCVCVYVCVCVCQTTNILEQSQEILNAQREVGKHTQAEFSDESCTIRLYSLVGYLYGMCIYTLYIYMYLHMCVCVCLRKSQP